MPTIENGLYLKRALLLAILIRVALAGVAYFSGRVMARHTEPLSQMYSTILVRWDSLNFFKIVEQGYSTAEQSVHLIAFLPLYPLLLKCFNFIFQNLLISGLVLNLIATVVAGYYFQCLLALDESESTTERALHYFYLFPVAYFLCVPYSEPVFLAYTLGAFYSARKKQWIFAGLAGLLASFTRLQGLILLPALFVEAWQQRKEMSVGQWFSLILIPIGFVFYLVINWFVFDDVLKFTEIQQTHFGNMMVMPWKPLMISWSNLVNQAPSAHGTLIHTSRLFAFIFTFLMLLLGLKHLRWSYQLYAWGHLVMALLSSWLMSLPRYSLCIFPLFIVCARWHDNEELHLYLRFCFAMGLGALAMVYCSGSWAF